MPFSPELIVYGLIFVGVFVLVEGVYLTVFGKSISLNSRVKRRLEMLDKGARREEGRRARGRRGARGATQEPVVDLSGRTADSSLDVELCLSTVGNSRTVWNCGWGTLLTGTSCLQEVVEGGAGAHVRARPGPAKWRPSLGLGGVRERACAWGAAAAPGGRAESGEAR